MVLEQSVHGGGIDLAAAEVDQVGEGLDGVVAGVWIGLTNETLSSIGSLPAALAACPSPKVSKMP